MSTAHPKFHIDDVAETIYRITTSGPGPEGELPLDDDMLRHAPSGDLFGLTQNAGMGWQPARLRQPEFLILSTQGGIRAPDGTPIALGYHTGHWEVGLLMEEAARTFTQWHCTPFAGYVSDPCDGRTQGTVGMFDSLAYRNDAAMVMRRLIRSLPTRKGVLGVATCDKGLPAMMIALASQSRLPVVTVPGGVTLPPTTGEDAGKIQTIGVRYAQNRITLDEAAALGCKACASPGGGCQFLGTAGTSQVVAEALGLAITHSALAPSGQAIWRNMARQSAQALIGLHYQGLTAQDILTDAALTNAMVVYAAFGGSTNLLLHIPAIAHAAGLPRPTVKDWQRINHQVPRLVDVLPNGPQGFVTVQAFLAGGVPEAMLHLRDQGLLQLDALTATGLTLGDNLDQWERSDRRRRVKEILKAKDGVEASDVIMPPRRATARGMTSTVTFPVGNLAPQGSVIKSTSIDPTVLDEQGVFRMTGPARVFTRERDAINAIKGLTDNPVVPGDVIVLMGRGPAGSGMEETYQLTSALRYLEWGKHVALITDARFSGVSTGACIGHIGPEALANGPLGRLRDGDQIRIEIDTVRLTGSLDFVGEAAEVCCTSHEGSTLLAAREPHPNLQPDDLLPDDTRLWAALQSASGGTWGGCVYDVDAITTALQTAQTQESAVRSAPARDASS